MGKRPWQAVSRQELIKQGSNGSQTLVFPKDTPAAYVVTFPAHALLVYTLCCSDVVHLLLTTKCPAYEAVYPTLHSC